MSTATDILVRIRADLDTATAALQDAELELILDSVFEGGMTCAHVDEELHPHDICVTTWEDGVRIACPCSELPDQERQDMFDKTEPDVFKSWYLHPARDVLNFILDHDLSNKIDRQNVIRYLTAHRSSIRTDAEGTGNRREAYLAIARYVEHCISRAKQGKYPIRWDAWLVMDEDPEVLH